MADITQQKIKTNGKVPLERKGSNEDEFYKGAPKSALDVPGNCLKELQDKNLVCRWIDIVELKRSQGFHQRGWYPYKFECLKGSNNPFAEATYDGYLIRAKAILAVKSEEEAIIHRQQVKTSRNRLSKVVEQAETEFRKFASGDKHLKVHGWDKKDESETE